MGVRVEREGAVSVIVLDRPGSRNAIDRATADALADAVRAFEADDSARVAVLWGAGGHFCAGADLKAIASGEPNRLDDRGDAPLGPSRIVPSKPVIAAIAGYAVAGGLELALWADLRVAEEDATLGVFCRRWGVPLIDGGTVRLPRLIGLSRALDLILTGRAVGAAEALAMGLVNRVVPPGEARTAAVALAASLAELPQGALLADLRAARQAFDRPLADAMAHEFEHGLPAVFEGAAGALAFSAQRRGGAQ